MLAHDRLMLSAIQLIQSRPRIVDCVRTPQTYHEPSIRWNGLGRHNCLKVEDLVAFVQGFFAPFERRNSLTSRMLMELRTRLAAKFLSCIYVKADYDVQQLSPLRSKCPQTTTASRESKGRSPIEPSEIHPHQLSDYRTPTPPRKIFCSSHTLRVCYSIPSERQMHD